MTKIGLWQIEDNGPVKIKESNVGLEKSLEDWIERDPTLLQSGLTINIAIGEFNHIRPIPLYIDDCDRSGWLNAFNLSTLFEGF